jgi:hypothetical protein
MCTHRVNRNHYNILLPSHSTVVQFSRPSFTSVILRNTIIISSDLISSHHTSLHHITSHHTPLRHITPQHCDSDGPRAASVDEVHAFPCLSRRSRRYGPRRYAISCIFFTTYSASIALVELIKYVISLNDFYIVVG